jgi:hypothetical protein
MLRLCGSSQRRCSEIKNESGHVFPRSGCRPVSRIARVGDIIGCLDTIGNKFGRIGRADVMLVNSVVRRPFISLTARWSEASFPLLDLPNRLTQLSNRRLRPGRGVRLARLRDRGRRRRRSQVAARGPFRVVLGSAPSKVKAWPELYAPAPATTNPAHPVSQRQDGLLRAPLRTVSAAIVLRVGLRKRSSAPRCSSLRH